MIYHGTGITEAIAFHPMGEPDNIHYFELTKLASEPVFVVRFCCDEEWRYAFVLEGNTIYEQVKGTIMDEIFEWDTIDELLDALGEIFEECFYESLLNADECEHDDCDGDCENCKYLN